MAKSAKLAPNEGGVHGSEAAGMSLHLLVINLLLSLYFENMTET